MFPGPIFGKELATAARRPRTYLVRALAAVAIAAQVAMNVEIPRGWWGAGALSPGEVAALANSAFHWFAYTQAVVVVVLVPLLVAGAVAEEKARGTLGLLLTSRLTSAEILADKLAARLLLTVVLMAVGLPILALIGLYGGVDPAEALTYYGGTLATAWLAAALSMLVSVHARSVAGAVVGAYAAGLAWLVLPVWLVAVLSRPRTPVALTWLRPLVAWLARSSPWSLSAPIEVWGRSASSPAALRWMVPEMALLQLGFGFALFALAAWRLRPVYHAQLGAGPARRRAWLGRVAGLRPRSRPPCGDDAMWWKECYSPESGWLARLVILLALTLVVLRIIGDAQQDFKINSSALNELFLHGLNLGPWAMHGYARTVMNYDICSTSAILYAAALAAAGVVAAASVAGERARGTWTSLLATPIDRAEILRAKMLGAAWAGRGALGMIVLLDLVALAATAMHPLGFVLGVAGVSAFLWFAIALGTSISLRSRDTTRAITQTMVILLVINLGPGLVFSPFFGGVAWVLGGYTPYLLIELSLSWQKFVLITQAVWLEPKALLFLAWFLAIPLAHALAAWFLTRAALRQIDRRDRSGISPSLGHR